MATRKTEEKIKGKHHNDYIGERKYPTTNGWASKAPTTKFLSSHLSGKVRDAKKGKRKLNFPDPEVIEKRAV